MKKALIMTALLFTYSSAFAVAPILTMCLASIIRPYGIKTANSSVTGKMKATSPSFLKEMICFLSGTAKSSSVDT